MIIAVREQRSLTKQKEGWNGAIRQGGNQNSGRCRTHASRRIRPSIFEHTSCMLVEMIAWFARDRTRGHHSLNCLDIFAMSWCVGGRILIKSIGIRRTKHDLLQGCRSSMEVPLERSALILPLRKLCVLAKSSNRTLARWGIQRLLLRSSHSSQSLRHIQDGTMTCCSRTMTSCWLMDRGTTRCFGAHSQVDVGTVNHHSVDKNLARSQRQRLLR